MSDIIKVKVDLHKPSGKWKYTGVHEFDNPLKKHEAVKVMRQKQKTGQLPGVKSPSTWSEDQTWMLHLEFISKTDRHHAPKILPPVEPDVQDNKPYLNLENKYARV